MSYLSLYLLLTFRAAWLILETEPDHATTTAWHFMLRAKEKPAYPLFGTTLRANIADPPISTRAMMHL
jgi:hypothetical protein